jgi:UDP-N-acetylmuramyl pentapeptide phosphotransferase/UDP-N-acetylglucosamine-1-phosphate transferase
MKLFYQICSYLALAIFLISFILTRFFQFELNSVISISILGYLIFNSKHTKIVIAEKDALINALKEKLRR